MLFTIFTPTYNRSKLLKRVYEALKKQTFKDFEWLIINDSSPDDTDEIVQTFIQEKPFFPIVYVKQEHGGKMRAISKAVDLAHGKWIMIHDDDDFMPENGLEITSKWAQIADNYPECAELSGVKNDTKGNHIRPIIPYDFKILSFAEKIKNGWNKDEAIFYKTEIIKKYKAPEFENEYDSHFSIPAFKMCKAGYTLLMFNDVVYIGDYIEGGLSDESIDGTYLLRIFNGYTEGVKLELSLNVGIKRKIEIIGKYSYIARKKGLGYFEISKILKRNIFICFILCIIAKLYLNCMKQRIRKNRITEEEK